MLLHILQTMGTSGSNSEGEKVEKYERGDIVGESNHRSKK